MTDIRLHLVDDDAGKRAMFGPRQAQWLLEQGLAELVRYKQTSDETGVNFYRALRGLSVVDLNERTLAVRELLECDFCPPSRPAAWRINVRPGFEVDLLGLSRAPLRRPVFACAECGELVRSNDKAGLIARSVDGYVAVGAELGKLSHVVKSALGPQLAGFVRAVFANRQGAPEEIA